MTTGAPQATTLPQERVHDVLQAFTACDSGDKGWLAREDLRMAMTSLLGYRPSKTELHALVPDGVRGNSGIDSAVFLQIMAPKLAARDVDDDIRQKFMLLDSHYRGYLKLEDVLPAFASVGVPEATIHRAFVEADVDRDGKISYKDFERMMKYKCKE
eukprot:TRINITY_DN434_c0_g1_i1.p1 TRINITY_DN434_c0_g1~~TRINITY_DN434_c0_g1_i1.p1  ORF type:complete len:170 (-),score=37.69 TRINITY_DN434_c0_g1_i1:149-619(-)